MLVGERECRRGTTAKPVGESLIVWTALTSSVFFAASEELERPLDRPRQQRTVPAHDDRTLH
jgi:hypothetical protein